MMRAALIALASLGGQAGAEEARVRLERTPGPIEIEITTAHLSDGTFLSVEATVQDIRVDVVRLNDVPLTEADWDELRVAAMVCDDGNARMLDEETSPVGGWLLYNCLVPQ